jgi:hypothetical protein
MGSNFTIKTRLEDGMTEKMIAFCGLECAGCEAYLATQADDLPAREALLEKWRVAFDAPGMTLANVTCDGCTSAGRLGGYCADCPVRACAVGRGLAHCARCDDYETCETLQGFIADIPEARANLAALRP